MRRLLSAVVVAQAVFALAQGGSPLCAEAGAPGEPRHGLSAFGALAYPPDFTHFNYVNPDAPKGGRLSSTGVVGVLTFDSLNPFILKGDVAEGMMLNESDTGGSLVFDSLMVRAGDEPDAVYGLIARDVQLTEDGRRATFTLRPQAQFHDGSPLTSADVVFTMETLKEKGAPQFAFPLRDVTVKAIGPYRVQFDFSGGSLRDLPLTVAAIPIMSKTYYTSHDITKTSLEPPLGSGPYQVSKVSIGSFVTYQRVADYWAKDLPVNVGRWNFDTITYQYYKDRPVGFQAFTAHTYDLREEFTSKTWATEYNFPAVKDGRVKRAILPDASPSGVQGFFLNTRRAPLSDIALREAMGLLFDFEWLNKTMFYGAYARTYSYFQNSDMEAKGVPAPEELALLEPYRAQLPARVFGDAIMPPASDGSGTNRTNVRAALTRLKNAGYVFENGVLKDKTGKRVAVEFLSDEPRMADIAANFAQNLKSVGIDASVRVVDSAQYQNRLKSFDYDIVVQRYSMRLSPGVELRQYYGCESAGTEGSYNLAGVCDPAADALIGDIINAKTRPEMVTAAHALDRVLRAGFYWVPHWYKGEHTIAYWDKFARPATAPKYQRGILDTWWVDPAKEAALGN